MDVILFSLHNAASLVFRSVTVVCHSSKVRGGDVSIEEMMSAAAVSGIRIFVAARPLRILYGVPCIPRSTQSGSGSGGFLTEGGLTVGLEALVRLLVALATLSFLDCLDVFDLDCLDVFDVEPCAAFSVFDVFDV